MTLYVPDASVVAKWLFPEVRTPEALRLLSGGHRLLAPDLLATEFAAVLLHRVRRRELTAAQGRRVLAALRRMPLAAANSTFYLPAALEISRRTGMSLNEGVYVAVAVAHGGVFVSGDRRAIDRQRKGPLGRGMRWVGEMGATSAPS